MRKNRNRTTRTPTGRAIYTTPRDIELLDFIQRHERVSSEEAYLYLAQVRLAPPDSSRGVKRRLSYLFHEKGFLDRPKKQRETDTFFSNHLMYSLTEDGRKELGFHRHMYAKPIAGWEQHLHFLTRLTVWVELACLKNGLQFIHRDTIFSNAEHPYLSMKINDVSHVPDDIFGIYYGERRYRYFALEADRATEDLKTIFRKIDTYDALIHSRDFMRWGIKNITVLICTLSPGRALTVLKYIENNTRYPKAFLVKSYPQFERPYAKATDFWGVLERTWMSAQGEYSILRP